MLRPAPKPLADFSLVDQRGAQFGRKELVGRWSFLFFGYTHCPDVCPATLSVLGQVQERIAKGRESPLVQTIFVSVDPQRDSPEKLAEYMAFFDSGFVGLTGDMEQIDGFTQQLGAGYMRGEETSPGNYVVNHTSAIFLIDPRARVVASFSQPHDPATIAKLFHKIRVYFRKGQ